MLTKYATLFAVLAVIGWFAARPDPAEASQNVQTPEPRSPVLIELFTSEGCSRCRPADGLLETFDRTQPVTGADLIVLSAHVDYWNRLGWIDPYSSPLFSERQQEYVRRLHLDGAYTPQLVIDGRADFVGSDERAVRAGILRAEARPKTAITLRAERTGPDVKVLLQVGDSIRQADLYLVLANDPARHR